MLDNKSGPNGPEICDIIVVSDNIKKWEALTRHAYPSPSCTVTERKYGKKESANNAYQISWKRNGDPIISVTFYPEKKKFMVQPGNQLDHFFITAGLLP